MSDFKMSDLTREIASELKSTPMILPQSDKGRYFNDVWWQAHYKEVEGPVLEAIARENDPSFDRRVNIMRIAERVDASNGSQLAKRGYTPTEITRYVTRAINKRLRQVAGGSDACYVIRNQKLTRLALEHKAAE